ncbi:hypothetical protein MKW98_002521 [Papaver atlanticum]|uniref:Uncharacterized protein n=1 Tax=Papaver atlanticum TaxID=357466 RepID=A0AAD4SAA6_9MAGN|nr:hypothetical protein MKW98_002521 [Papaver atlanticum]
MATGNTGRGLISTLLAVIFVMYLIVLGLASWSVDKYINGEQHHPHLGGNPATSFMLVFALLASVLGISSVITGLLHHRVWRSETLGSAASLAIISWTITALTFGLACKEIALGGHRGRRLVIYSSSLLSWLNMNLDIKASFIQSCCWLAW